MTATHDQSTTFPEDVPVCIPARWGSKRLPGKLLAKLPNGKLVLEHAVETARSATNGRVVVLADDELIEEAARKLEVEVYRSIDPARNGSERIAEALRRGWLGTPMPTRVVNLQADAVGATPALLHSSLRALEQCPTADLGTVAIPAADSEARGRTTVQRDGPLGVNFSRIPLPNPEGLLLHVGIYAYCTAALLEVARAEPGRRELDESLEQLRWLETGRTIAVSIVDAAPEEAHAIDVATDLEALAPV